MLEQLISSLPLSHQRKLDETIRQIHDNKTVVVIAGGATELCVKPRTSAFAFGKGKFKNDKLTQLGSEPSPTQLETLEHAAELYKMLTREGVACVFTIPIFDAKGRVKNDGTMTRIHAQIDKDPLKKLPEAYTSLLRLHEIEPHVIFQTQYSGLAERLTQNYERRLAKTDDPQAEAITAQIFRETGGALFYKVVVEGSYHHHKIITTSNSRLDEGMLRETGPLLWSAKDLRRSITDLIQRLISRQSRLSISPLLDPTQIIRGQGFVPLHNPQGRKHCDMSVAGKIMAMIRLGQRLDLKTSQLHKNRNEGQSVFTINFQDGADDSLIALKHGRGHDIVDLRNEIDEHLLLFSSPQGNSLISSRETHGIKIDFQKKYKVMKDDELTRKIAGIIDEERDLIKAGIINASRVLQIGTEEEKRLRNIQSGVRASEKCGREILQHVEMRILAAQIAGPYLPR